jgi:chromosomal replication initiator protein
LAYRKLQNLTPDLTVAKSLLKSLIFSPSRAVTPKKIIQAVAEFYDLKEKDLSSTSRKKEVVKPRQVAMYLLREELKGSYPFIGRKFGGKDHTTAIHAYGKILNELQKDEKLEEEINLIRQRIVSG